MFLMRIFPDEYIQRISRYLIIFLVIFVITGELPLVFRCIPMSAIFDPSKMSTSLCISDHALLILALFHGVVMMLTDLMIFIMPMLPLWRLKVPLRERLGVMVIFGLGPSRHFAPPFLSLYMFPG